jgi:hypothetical protein
VFESLSIVVVFVAYIVGSILFAAHSAVHTQAKLARYNERDGFIDALVWINRKLTGKPERHPLTGR